MTEDWRSDSLCLRRDPRLWEYHTDRPEANATRVRRWRKAAGICRDQCPVQDRCLQDRTTSTTRSAGVFGGQVFRGDAAEPSLELLTEPADTPTLSRCQECGRPLTDSRRRSCSTTCRRKVEVRRRAQRRDAARAQTTPATGGEA